MTWCFLNPNEASANDPDLVNRKLMLGLISDFRFMYQDEPWSDKRQETIERLLFAINKKKLQGLTVDEALEKQGEHEKRATLLGLKKDDEKKQISKFFEGTVNDITKQSRLGALAAKALRGVGMIEKVSQVHRPGKIQLKRQDEITEETKRIRLQAVDVEKHRKQVIQRIRKRIEHQRVSAKATPQRPKTKVNYKFVPRKPEKALQSGKHARESIRQKFLKSIVSRHVSMSPNAENPEGSMSFATSASKTDLFVRNVQEKLSSESSSEFANRFYRNQKCLFNSAQMEYIEKVFKQLVAQKDDKTLPQEDGEKPVVGMPKSFHMRKVLSYNQFHRAIHKHFKTTGGENGFVRRVFAAVCGRDPHLRKEGVTMQRFALFLSICHQGTLQQKMFLCFEILDTDRDGKISKHDIFDLLRGGAESTASEDFAVLLRWVAEKHEARAERERVMSKHLEKIQKRESKRNMARHQNSRKMFSRTFYSEHEEDNDDDDDEGYEESVTNLQKMVAEESRESTLDFDGFRQLWPRRRVPQIIKDICACFITPGEFPVSYQGGRKTAVNTSPENNDSSARKQKESESVVSSLFDSGEPKRKVTLMNNIELTRAKHVLLKNLKLRRQTVEEGSKEDAETTKKNDLDDDSSHDDGEDREDPDQEIPGKFLRSIRVDVETAKRLRKLFQQMRPERNDKISKASFVNTLVNANIGFEKDPKMVYICERLFAAINTDPSERLSFVDFITGYAIASHGAPQTQARLAFDCLKNLKTDTVSAHELEACIECGLEEIDPITTERLLDLIVEKVTRSEPGVITKDDFVALGEFKQAEEQEMMDIEIHKTEEVTSKFRSSKKLARLRASEPEFSRAAEKFELLSSKKRREFRQRYQNVDYIFLYKIVQAFSGESLFPQHSHIRRDRICPSAIATLNKTLPKKL